MEWGRSKGKTDGRAVLEILYVSRRTKVTCMQRSFRLTDQSYVSLANVHISIIIKRALEQICLLAAVEM